MIKRAHRDLGAKKEKLENQPNDAYQFINTFNLKLYGGKKEFKKYIKENQNLVPPGLKLDLIYHIVNEMPQECFDSLIPDSKLSKEEIKSKAQELYSELPFDKLKDRSMVSEYIKWEIKYKKGVNYEVIHELKELCGLYNNHNNFYNSIYNR